MTELSVIILSYNTKEVTKNCLNYLVKSLSNQKIEAEIIVVDNGSADGSPEMLLNYVREIKNPRINFELILNKKNLGYPAANNQGIKIAGGEFVLLLNSDVYIESEIDWQEIFKYMRSDSQIGVLTVKVNLENGKIDPASHRGFPTIWRAFSYFSGLEKIFARIPLLNKIFGGYHLTSYDLNNTHEIDSPTGAFYMAKKTVLDRVGGFDAENFFFYGEDLDLSYRIKKFGFKIVYYPKYEVTHLKNISGIKKQDESIRIKAKENFYEAMRIFYRKHYEKKYPSLINKFIYWSIDLKKKIS